MIGVSNTNIAKMHAETRTIGEIDPLRIEAVDAKPSLSLTLLRLQKDKTLGQPNEEGRSQGDKSTEPTSHATV